MSNNWTKCYEDGWKDHIVPESFQHPAKMSYSLLKRILSHCKDEGWGGVIVDPFGGIGSTGILGAYEGYQVICVELEAKFVNLAKENFELHRKAWEQFGNPYPVIIQGDSRRFCELVESADIIVSSPPFQECGTGAEKESHNRQVITSGTPTHKKGAKIGLTDYGQTPGQLGSRKAGKGDMVISSPPFQESSGAMAKPETYVGFQHVGSVKHKSNDSKAGYGQTKGNLGNLKAGDVDVILSSPPYEASIHGSGADAARKRIEEGRYKGQRPDVWISKGNIAGSTYGDGYGAEAGNLGNDKGPTFWQAAKEIVQQCYQILRPGGHAIWVCKDFVRKGKRVPFSNDWQRLCESVGFKTIHRHKAMLVKETKYESLFGHDIVKKTERKSFFRRLAEAKGSPKINWEDVICMIRS